MWQKTLVIILLFYFFALLQNNFFAHFNLFGASLNLVFILFFLMVFFKDPKGTPGNYQIIFLAAVAGIFLDIFSFTYLGPSIVVLLIIGFLLKKIQSLLKNRENKYPFVYFLPLFIIFLLAYKLLLGMTSFGVETIFFIIYNSLIASAVFYIYKWQKFIK